MKSLILDLDNTIIDSEVLAPLRAARNWSDCRRGAHKTLCFPNISVAISAIRRIGIRVGIVTSSPSNYAAHMLNHHQIGHDALVAYHDVSRRKPDAEAIYLCLQRLSADASGCTGVGDQVIDAIAYKAAGIRSWGAGWSPYLVRDAAWDYVANDPMDLLREFNIKI